MVLGWALPRAVAHEHDARTSRHPLVVIHRRLSVSTARPTVASEADRWETFASPLLQAYVLLKKGRHHGTSDYRSRGCTSLGTDRVFKLCSTNWRKNDFFTFIGSTRTATEHDLRVDIEETCLSRVVVAAYQSVLTARSRSRRLTIRSIMIPGGSL